MSRFGPRSLVTVVVFLSALLPAGAQAGKTLPCAVVQEPFEYTLADLHGPRQGFDRMLCVAVAAALGPGTRAAEVQVPDEAAALKALLSGKVDLVPTVSDDLSHATDSQVALTPPILLDGTGLLVPLSVPSVRSLAGQKICFFSGTETETALHTWFRLHHLDFLPYPFSEEGEMQAAFTSGNCPAIAGDLTRLAAVRAATDHPERYKLLPDQLAPDPLSSATRRSDPSLSRAVFAVEQMMLNAAALGITRENLPQLAGSNDAALTRLFGHTHELGPAAGLDDGWPLRVLRQVGSYTDLLRTAPLALPVPQGLPLK